ncbi:hypothetical protein ACO22_07446, partial [Paracoccidioides brasiliensis]
SQSSWGWATGQGAILFHIKEQLFPASIPISGLKSDGAAKEDRVGQVCFVLVTRGPSDVFHQVQPRGAGIQNK